MHNSQAGTHIHLCVWTDKQANAGRLAGGQGGTQTDGQVDRLEGSAGQ